DAATGQPKWTAESGAEINAGANFYQDKVLFASQDGGLYCLARADGKLAWKYTIDNMIQCSPTVAGNRGFLAGCDGKLHIVDLDNGQGIAQLDIKDPTLSTPAAVGDRVYFGTQGGRFLAIDWKEQNIAWSYEPKRRSPLLSSAAVSQGVVVFGGKDREVHALDAKTGGELWSAPVRAAVDSSPVIAGNLVYLGTGNGRLLAFNLKTGKQAWEYEAGGGFPASPAVAAGRLVIGNDAGDLYCFGK
ncbi:MAG TPA: PQQ-binding-like beta-propeller repeat protein, partial [Pirellulales bacterium]|nr:PQQ-binding-like beta-propeller repeat protein [Pirellulales bacterium]